MKYIKIILVLTLVASFSAGILSSLDLFFQEKILENQRKAFNDAVIKIIPQTTQREKLQDVKAVYEVFDREDKLLGYIFLAEGQGYADKIKIICGITSNLEELLGIEIIESKETPGLGAKINGEKFKDQFKDLDVSRPIRYTKAKPKNPNEIQAITGATVSSRSVVNIINKRIEEIGAYLKKQ